MPRTRTALAAPDAATLALLRLAYLADTRQAHRVIMVGATEIHLALVTLRRVLTHDPTGQVEVQARVLRGEKHAIDAAWMRTTAARLGLTDCQGPLNQVVCWTIRGTLA